MATRKRKERKTNTRKNKFRRRGMRKSSCGLVGGGGEDAKSESQSFLKLFISEDNAKNIDESIKNGTADINVLPNYSDYIEKKDYRQREQSSNNENKLMNVVALQYKNLMVQAVKYGYTDLAKTLIKKGVDVNIRGSYPNDPILKIAADGGHAAIVEMLIENGAKTILPTEHLNVEVFEVLLKHSKKPDEKFTYTSDKSYLEYYVSNNKPEYVKMLIDNSAKVNDANADGNTPLHLATVSYFFVEPNANANEQEKNAENFNHLHLVENTNVNEQEKNAEIVKMLIDNGAKVNDANADGNTPLHLAAKRNKVEIVKMLIDNGAKVNDANADGYTPLHLAAIYGHAEIVTILIERGADVNAKNNDDDTPLHLAANYAEIVKMLIERGADVNAVNNNNDTYLTITERNKAAEERNKKAAEERNKKATTAKKWYEFGGKKSRKLRKQMK